MCFLVMFRSSLAVHEPLQCIILMQILRVRCQKLDRLWPERTYTLRRVIQIDSEAVRLIVVLHEPEDIVVDIAVEMDFGFDAPVVAHVGEGGVFVEHATVPAAHLVVGFQVGVLDVLFLEDAGGFLEEVFVYPVWGRPVVFGYEF